VKRALKWTAVVLAAVVVLIIGAAFQQKAARHADASPAALAAAVSDDDVRVDEGAYLTFRPIKTPERMGVVFYPGAFTDIRGYAPTLKPLASAGYRVVVTPMPFELSILAIDRALAVMAANPDIKRWAILGHSIGGAAAGSFAHGNPNAVEGVIIWDSYPPATSSLAEFPKPAWHIHRATPDGKPPEKFAAQRGLFPPSSTWVPVPGGIHMNFGAFSGGGYVEDWEPSISQQEQHKLVVAATLRALADIEGANKKGGP
jgi:pimeloyl-ACP methyl ester carboxylesterase